MRSPMRIKPGKMTYAILLFGFVCGAFLFYTAISPKKHHYDPSMIKWAKVFNVDIKSKKHPFAINRIVRFEEYTNYLCAEIPFNFDLLKEQGWDVGGPAGKFYLFVNGSLKSSTWYKGTNGNCWLPFGAGDFKNGSNSIRFDIIIFSPTRGASIDAEGVTSRIDRAL